MTITNFNPLSEAQIKDICPAVYATEPAERTSSRYSFIPTHEILNVMNDFGWFATDIKTLTPKGQSKMHGYHSVILRHESFNCMDVTEDVVIPEILLNNNHMGLRSYSWLLGLIKFVCANGLVTADEYTSQTVKHRGVVLEDIKKGLAQVINKFQTIGSDIQNYQTLQMTEIAKKEFAYEAVMEKHLNPTKEMKIREKDNIQQYLVPRRKHDNNNSLWSVFNVVQENLMKGGISSQIEKIDENTGKIYYRKASTKPIKDEKRRQALNQALWVLMAKYYSWK